MSGDNTHWLSTLAQRAGLGEASGAGLDSNTPIGEAWHQVAESLGISQADLARGIAGALHLPLADLASADPAALTFLPEGPASAYGVLPLRATNRELILATSNPLDFNAEREIAFLSGRRIVFEIASPDVLSQASEHGYGSAAIAKEALVRETAEAAGEAEAEAEAGAEPEAGAEAETEAETVVEVEAEAVGESEADAEAEVEAEAAEAGAEAEERRQKRRRQKGQQTPREERREKQRRQRRQKRREKAEATAVAEPETTAPEMVGAETAVAEAEATAVAAEAEVAAGDAEAPAEAEAVAEAAAARATAVAGAAAAAEAKAIAVAEAETAATEAAAEADAEGRAAAEAEAAARAAAEAAVAAEAEAEAMTAAAAVVATAASAAAAAEASAAGAAAEAAAIGVAAAKAAATATAAAVAKAAELEAVRDTKVLRTEPSGYEENEVAVAAVVTGEDVELEGDGGRRGLARSPRRTFPGVFHRLRTLLGFGSGSSDSSEPPAGTTAVRIEEETELIAERPSDEEAARPELLLEESSQQVSVELDPEAGGAPESEASPSTEWISTSSASEAHILIVDDADGDRLVLRTILVKGGFEVSEADDGRTAIPILVNGGGIDAILLDLQLKQMDGLEMLKTIRKSQMTRGIPVVILTKSEDPEDERLLLQAGADDYLRKPVDPLQLIDRIRAVLRRARL